MPANQELIEHLTKHLCSVISETNGITLNDTLELASLSFHLDEKPQVRKTINEFRKLLAGYEQDEVDINTLLNHPISDALQNIFKSFPIPFREEHIHLTGSLTADFIYPRLKKLIDGPHGNLYLEKIKAVYGDDAKVDSVEDIHQLITLKDDEAFDRYLEILLLPKMILNSRQAHQEAAYHMASELYHSYNVGMIRLKFTLSRATSSDFESVPGIEHVSEEDVVLGLFEGFMEFKKRVPSFDFVLSPSFRKEASFFDNKRFKKKKDHFIHQVNSILTLLDQHPQLIPYLRDVDTVGNERDLYRKSHFQDMRHGFRKLHYKGFSIRSHHGETWHTLRKGVQAVDNALNIWHIDTLEHGLSLGINPNFYYHSLYQRVINDNAQSMAVKPNTSDYKELLDMDWSDQQHILSKLLEGTPLSSDEQIHFVKIKFHTAREVEHYQHDVLNRMIHKNVSLIALPSSNNRLTECFPDYKDHPFSWWEKKGVQLGVGTDNYITLNTNYLKELLIVLYTDSNNLKITKLLMVATGESRRPYISQMLWRLREKFALMND